MKIIRIITPLLIACLFNFQSCKKDDDTKTPFVPASPTNEVQIRVRNISSSIFVDTYVNTSGGDHNFGTIAAQRQTLYQTFDSAYRYAFIELKVNQETLTIQPIDYVGESKLAPGKYTYELNTNNRSNPFTKLELKFIQD